jgi:hypothetical protein
VYGAWGAGGHEVILYRPDLGVDTIPVTEGEDLGFGAPREMFRIPSDWKWASPTADFQHILILKQADKGAPGIAIAVNWMAGIEQ